MNVPYDFLSVMHYGRTAFGSGRITIQTIDPKNQYKIGQRGGFSDMDILQMNLLYKCPGAFLRSYLHIFVCLFVFNLF